MIKNAFPDSLCKCHSFIIIKQKLKSSGVALKCSAAHPAGWIRNGRFVARRQYRLLSFREDPQRFRSTAICRRKRNLARLARFPRAYPRRTRVQTACQLRIPMDFRCRWPARNLSRTKRKAGRMIRRSPRIWISMNCCHTSANSAPIREFYLSWWYRSLSSSPGCTSRKYSSL